MSTIQIVLFIGHLSFLFFRILFFQTFRIVDVQREDRGIYQVMARGLYDQVVMKAFQLDLGGELYFLSLCLMCLLCSNVDTFKLMLIEHMS